VSHLLNFSYFVHIDIWIQHAQVLFYYVMILHLGVKVLALVLLCHPWFFQVSIHFHFLCCHRYVTKLYLCNLLRWCFLDVKKCVPFLVPQLCYQMWFQQRSSCIEFCSHYLLELCTRSFYLNLYLRIFLLFVLNNMLSAPWNLHQIYFHLFSPEWGFYVGK
jgi:hypothetical protein